MLELKVDNNSSCQISGQFTRQYINDIMLPGQKYIADSSSPVFNFKGVNICDSAGVAVIIYWWRIAAMINKKISFECLSEKMLAIMYVSGIEVEDNKLKI